MNYQDRKKSNRIIVSVCLLLFSATVFVTSIIFSLFWSTFTFLMLDSELHRGKSSMNHWGYAEFKIVYLIIVPITMLLIFMHAFKKIEEMRAKSGNEIAKNVGAKPVVGTLDDFYKMRLRNIVEEISVAAGVPVPYILVLDDEKNINAFAAGYSPCDAAVVVTQGALIRLNRDELQGVIGHEFSHILNGDMRLNTTLIVWIAMIMGVYNQAHNVLRHDDIRSKIAYGVPMIIIGSFGMVAGKLLQAFVNREREYMADACAVQLSRQTLGIVGALKKIGSLDGGSGIKSSALDNVSHMMFSQSSLYAEWLATHPPIIKRIKILDPHFNPDELDELRQRWRRELPDGQKEDNKCQDRSSLKVTNVVLDSGVIAVSALTGQFTSDPDAHYQKAKTIISNISDTLLASAHHYQDSISLILALLYNINASSMEKQQLLLKDLYDDETLAKSKSLYCEIATLPVECRLPLISLCFPTICRHSKDEIQQLQHVIKDILVVDYQETLSEYCLRNLINTHLNDFLQPVSSVNHANQLLINLVPEVSTLLSVLVKAGYADDGGQDAYQAGMARALPGIRAELQTISLYAEALDPVLPKLDNLAPVQKKILIESIVIVIAKDNKVTIEESEMLRMICSALHRPVPIVPTD